MAALIKRQGWPLSQLLYTLALLSLAEAIMKHGEITEVKLGAVDHKIAFFSFFVPFLE